MTVLHLSFEEFVERSRSSRGHPLSSLVQNDSTVHVFALTRDRCTGCEIQKPQYENLAASLEQKYRGQVQFASIHVSETDRFRDRLQEFRRILRFAAYPTYLILMREDSEILETYRAIEPPMEEIARNIDLSVELANR